jgi:glycosyltransferase involved in cell wall biosynthesis
VFGRPGWFPGPEADLRVEQFLPTLGFRDAVATHTLRTQRELARRGMGGRIWAEQWHPAMARLVRRYQAFQPSRRGANRTLLLYQASTGSRGLVDFLLDRVEPKTLYYHNITPAHFFEPYDGPAAANLMRGRQELARLARVVPVALAASNFNAAELRALGVQDVRVIPPWMPNRVHGKPDPRIRSRLLEAKSGIDVLFVGRVVPNKGHLHLLRVLAALRAAVDSRARLLIVGAAGPTAYMRMLHAARERLCPQGAVFVGSVSDSTLATHYSTADVFLSLSEHEGFGIPLIEAMRHQLPVVAFDAGATEETLGGAGVLLRTLDAAVIAELVGRIARDESLRNRIVEGQNRRLAALDQVPRPEQTVAALRACWDITDGRPYNPGR